MEISNALTEHCNVLEIREIHVADYMGDMKVLAAQNWQETGCPFELDPDLQLYQALIDSGGMRAVGAFDGARMIGYSTVIIAPHTFNPRVICAFTEALFVAPGYRKGSAAAKLIRATEQLAQERGARWVMWHTRADTPLARVFEKRGYLPCDVVVMKELHNGD